ncbi:hypothetical protein KAR91_79930 [Candidatus Pacearchaeota archaeon]|nr:hypothetical protein [Candidatus Pacearchaeota archaeon]
MTTPDTEPNTREGLFRFGQRFVNKNIQFKYYRDIMTRLLCVDIINEAFSDGVILTQKGEDGKKTEDPVEWYDEWKVESDKHWKEHLNSYYLERRNGQALTQWIVAKGKLKLYSFSEDDYEPEYDELTAELIGGKSFLKIVNIPKTKDLFFGTLKGVDKPHSTIEQVQEIMTRRKEIVNDGLSILEIAWDVLTAIYMLMSHSAYYVAKAGAGLMKAKVPASELAAGADSATLARELNEFGSSQNVIIEVTDIDGDKDKKYEIEYITVQSSVQWMELFKMYLIELSILTGIPVSMLEGITPGQLEGALVNESDKFDALEDIQQIYEQHTRHYCEFIADFIGRGEEEFDIGYNVRRDQTKQLIEKLTAFSTISGRKIKPDKLANMLNLELTEEDLEEKQEMPMMVPGQNPLDPTGNGKPEEEPIEEEVTTDEL